MSPSYLFLNHSLDIFHSLSNQLIHNYDLILDILLHVLHMIGISNPEKETTFNNNIHFIHHMDITNIVYGLYLRGLFFIYICAFLSLLFQVRLLASSKGLSPVFVKMEKLHEHFHRKISNLKLFTLHPSLLWVPFHHSKIHIDAFLYLLPIAGILFSFVGFFSIIDSRICLFLCYLIYLSLDIAVEFNLPWDLALLESGFFASVFLPPLGSLYQFLTTVSTSITTTAASVSDPSSPDALLDAVINYMSIQYTPSLFASFGARWLLIRLMLGMGRSKFSEQVFALDGQYIREFFIAMPFPSMFSYLGHKYLPQIAFNFLLFGMWLTEIPIPVISLFAWGIPRILCGLAQINLQVGIIASGCFGHYNVLTMVLSIPLLDPGLPPSSIELNLENGLQIVFILVWSFLGFVQTRFVTSMNAWPFLIDRAVKNDSVIFHPYAQRILKFYKFISPFKILNPYGVFPPHSFTPIRSTPVLEGSWDNGKTWQRYEWKFLSSSSQSKPFWLLTLYTPRLDIKVWFVARGIAHENFNAPVFRANDPYSFTSVSILHRLVHRIFEGNELVKEYFNKTGDPPQMIRVGLHLLTVPNSPALVRKENDQSSSELITIGSYWREEKVGNLLDQVDHKTFSSLYPWSDWIPEPEEFHWSYIAWKDRAVEYKKTLDRVNVWRNFNETEKILCSRQMLQYDGTELKEVAFEINESDLEKFKQFVLAISQGKYQGSALCNRKSRILLNMLSVSIEGSSWVRKYLESKKSELISDFRYTLSLHDMILFMFKEKIHFTDHEVKKIESIEISSVQRGRLLQECYSSMMKAQALTAFVFANTLDPINFKQSLIDSPKILDHLHFMLTTFIDQERAAKVPTFRFDKSTMRWIEN